MTQNQTNHFLFKTRNQNSIKFHSIHPSQIPFINLYDQKSNESLPSQKSKFHEISFDPSITHLIHDSLRPKIERITSFSKRKSKFHEINPRIFMTKNRTNHFFLKNQNSMKFRLTHPSHILSTILSDQKSLLLKTRNQNSMKLIHEFL